MRNFCRLKVFEARFLSPFISLYRILLLTIVSDPYKYLMTTWKCLRNNAKKRVSGTRNKEEEKLFMYATANGSQN